MPNLNVIRPADGNETQVAWRIALESTEQPTALVLTRQGLPTLDGTSLFANEGVRKGAYIISDSKVEPEVILLATGSEVSLAVEAQKALLEDKGVHARVVSMPSWNLFEEQDEEYKHSIIPPHIKKRVAIEMASSLGWERYVGDEGIIIGVDKFGASAKGDKIIKE